MTNPRPEFALASDFYIFGVENTKLAILHKLEGEGPSTCLGIQSTELSKSVILSPEFLRWLLDFITEREHLKALLPELVEGLNDTDD